VKRIISGGLFALFLVLVFEALALFGVISMAAGHIAVFAAWVVGSILISTEVIPGKKVPHKILAILGLAVLLACLDLWAIRVKFSLDAESRRPQVTLRPQPQTEKKLEQPELHEDNTVTTAAASIPSAGLPRRSSANRSNPLPIVGKDKGMVVEHVTQGVGSAFSVNQQGGVTAGTIIGVLPPKPLVLSETQSQAVTAAMQPFAGKHIRIWVVNSTPMNEKFANDLGAALTRSQIAWDKSSTVMMFWAGHGLTPEGLSCKMSPDMQDFANTLGEVLVTSKVIIDPIPCRTVGVDAQASGLSLYITEK
jgi:hypothetical protein